MFLILRRSENFHWCIISVDKFECFSGTENIKLSPTLCNLSLCGTWPLRHFVVFFLFWIFNFSLSWLFTLLSCRLKKKFFFLNPDSSPNYYISPLRLINSLHNIYVSIVLLKLLSEIPRTFLILSHLLKLIFTVLRFGSSSILYSPP